ncbi:MAG: hypothetical protein J5I93_10355, partial [Pirellulaceae bacterium]|nr:hypothetical protein [Pirellulaceae bacterium]
MNARWAWQRLWWKELRQLIPLAVLLTLLVILLLGLQALTAGSYPASVLQSTTVALCFGMPGLFACGVGAVLVGYEKDSRTLRWLANLPVPPRWIVRVKSLAALLCLAGLWAVSALILAVVSSSDVYPFTTDFTGGWIAPAFSVFLLFAGFALAWRIQSALTGLLLVIPIASLPLLLAGAINAWVWPAERDPFSPAASYTQLACIGLGIVLAVWLTERFGGRALAAQTADTSSLIGFFRSWRGLFGAPWIATASIRPRLSALVWQFACQSRAWLAGNLVTLIVAVVLLAPAVEANHPIGRSMLGLLLLVLSSSWLGAMVFQSDMLQGRIRFLSDRGISPAATWMTRQAAPAGLLALACLALPLAGGIAS